MKPPIPYLLSSNPSRKLNRPNRSKHLFLASLILSVTAMSETSFAGDVTWRGNDSNAFNSIDNYTPTLSSSSEFANSNLIFDTPLSRNLTMSANLNVGSITIEEGASGFFLSQGSNRSLAFKGYGITVRDNAHATVNANIAFLTSNEAQELVFNVGTNGSLRLGGNLSPVTRTFVKDGGGTLIIERGSSSLRKLANGQGAFAFNEGTVEILPTARLGWEEASTALPEELQISLGTSTQKATLKGSGNVDGQLITAGVDQSEVAPDSELTIHTFNAIAGATLSYTLGDGLIKGDGIFTSSTTEGGLAFNFQGGEVDRIYTLLQYSEIVGMEPGDLSILSTGYELDASFGTGGWLIDAANGSLQVRFSSIPEPGSAGLAVMSLAACALAVRLKGKRWN